MNETRLRAIFFDVDDTLFSTTEFARRARAAAIDNMREFGFKMHKDDAMSELLEVIQEFSSNYEQHFDKLLLRIPEHYYEGVNPAILVAAAVAGYHDTKMRELSAHEDVIEVLKLLHRYSDLRLGIISNGVTIKQAEKIVRLGVYPYIDHDAIFISDQAGMNKQNVKLFLRACREIGVSPHEAMYVGDDPRNDIDPPNTVGMVSVQSRRGGKHEDSPSSTKPDYEIHNFWDLLEILASDFGIDVQAAQREEREQLTESEA